VELARALGVFMDNVNGERVCFCPPSDISGVGSIQMACPAISLILMHSLDVDLSVRIGMLRFVDMVPSLANLVKTFLELRPSYVELLPPKAYTNKMD
jgi:hypothetical protein